MTAKEYNGKRLFLMSCMALVVTAMTFAIRARLEPMWESEFQLSATNMAIAMVLPSGDLPWRSLLEGH
jgi:hypothetical protein